jgi:succinate-semialdehyde dehydrogenase/glutarate-semialdehyde dehydrogenase
VPYRSVNPATGEVLKTFTKHTDQEMMDTLTTADEAFVSWAARPIEEFAKIISRAISFCSNGRASRLSSPPWNGKRIAESRGEVGMERATDAPYESFVHRLEA